MNPGNVLALFMGSLDLVDDLVKRHRGRVYDACTFRCGGNDLFRHQRAREKADRAGLDELQAANGDEIGIARSGANEMNGHDLSSVSRKSEMSVVTSAIRDEGAASVATGAASTGFGASIRLA